jgi:hypothetical protein
MRENYSGSLTAVSIGAAKALRERIATEAVGPK